MTLEAALAEGIRALGLEIEPAIQSRLLAYVALLEKWNRTYNLTAIREPGRMVSHHLLDSLAVLPYLPQARSLRIVDIGSGGGLPGIPIALACPAGSVALVESSQKKAAFLRQARAELSLANAEIVVARIEDYEPDSLFDVAVSRAYAELDRFASDARRLTPPAGRWLAMKGTYPAEELAKLPPGVRVTAVQRLDVPGLDAMRHLVIMERAG
ncbi:MAG TPA: 16S rRNA (guanine(527)-N(7))-methyltransferase RsmG [Casimicrobiaceae bacterium]|nr:16S rRNA (guanine(527)-N(7))-methyltransferase RsmG [Casimicrobiaceae bacterium]